jgi:uncharacterized protein (TIRG00374 family)
MNARKASVNSLKILFTIFLLYMVFQSVDLSKISHSLKDFKLETLILILTVCWIGQFICAERWRIFAHSLQMKGGYLNFVQMYFVGMFFNIGLPTLVGGDIIKAFIVSRKNNRSLQIGLASVLQDRASGLISLLAYGTLAILLCPMAWRGIPLWTLYLVSWIAVGILLWLIAKGKHIYRRFIVSENPTIPQRMLRPIAELHQALEFSRLSRGALARITLYSFIYSGLLLWALRQVTVAAGHPVAVIPFFAMVPLVTLATMLPVTLSGLGIRELFYVEALSLAGVPRHEGLVISLAISALLVVCNLAGMLFLPGIPKGIRKQVQGVTEHSIR